jgi:hypothetical protein
MSEPSLGLDTFGNYIFFCYNHGINLYMQYFADRLYVNINPMLLFNKKSTKESGQFSKITEK